MLTVVDARVAFVLAVYDLLPGVYMWGGEEWEEGGHDCSGLVCDALLRVRRHWPDLYDGQRRTAAGLRSYYIERGCREHEEVDILTPGSFAFLTLPGRQPHHIRVHLFTSPGFLQSPTRRLPVGPVAIEAGGGGSTTTSPREALLTAAVLRPVATDRQRGGSMDWSALDPFEVLL